MMSEQIERIFINDTWLGVGGNTPWEIEGKITEIILHEIDPRNFSGADSALIEIYFDSGRELRIKTNDYMVLLKDVGDE